MADLCAKCQTHLVIELDDSDDDVDVGMADAGPAAKTVPDDVHLPCGCHLHWDCLMENDNYELATCPACTQRIGSDADPAAGEQVLVDYRNEGGLQQRLDVLPMMREEAYLRTFPEEARARAFLELCREGDHRAVADLLNNCRDDDVDEGAGGPASFDNILRYQDPLGDMQSALHAAVANGRREVAWLLLLLASQLPELEFPALVYQEAAALGVMREDQTDKVDIRSLRDAHGRTAEDVARETGVVWTGWLGNGRLAMP